MFNNITYFHTVCPLKERILSASDYELKDIFELISKINAPITMATYEALIMEKWHISTQVFNKLKKDFLNKTPTEYAKKVIEILENKKLYLSYNLENSSLYFFNTYWKRMENERSLKSEIRKNLPQSKESERFIVEVLNAIVDLLIPESKLHLDNNSEDKIYVNNGVLDINTLEISKHSHFNFNKYALPIDYIPNATAPNWKKVLKQWINSDDTILFLQEFIGYCLLSNNKYQKALILLGYGSNGKSTFLDIISELIGKINISNFPLQRLGGRFDSAYLQDKLINIAGDLDPTYMTETGIVKDIISGGTITGEIKGGKTFSFIANCKLLFSCNELPKSRDKSDGWYRRFFIVNFPNKFTPTSKDFDPNLKSNLLKELPGILNWTIEGLKRLIANKKFTISEEMEFEMSKYKASNDNVAYFLQNFLTTTVGKHQVISEAYSIYQDYCNDYNINPIDRNQFTSRLKSLGINSGPTTINNRSIRVLFDCKFEYNASS